MRGRLLFIVYAELVRLDAKAMTAVSPNIDPDFREPIVERRELPPIQIPCQVEPDSFDALSMTGAGDEPSTRVHIVFHFDDLEKLGLVDIATGRALVAPGDRVAGFYDRDRRLVQATDLYVTEARSVGFGFGLLRPRRNLLLVALEARAASARSAP